MLLLILVDVCIKLLFFIIFFSYIIGDTIRMVKSQRDWCM